jgi:hypothetical protein
VETLAICSPYDFLGVNNAVRNGHQVMLGPLNFCRSLDWPPVRGLAEYVKEVKRIRDRLQETVFYGEVLGQTGVTLTDKLPGGVEYNVFRNRDTGLRVCVLSNSSRTPAKAGLGGFGPPGSPEALVRTPFKAARRLPLPGIVEVPAEGIVFVAEEAAERVVSAAEEGAGP